MVIDQQNRTRKCIRCSAEVVTQAYIVDGIELMANARLVCNSCSSAETLASKRTEWNKVCPWRFRDTDPDKVGDQDAMSEVIGWQYSHDGVLAYGPTGLCKTRCVYMLLRRLFMKENRTVAAVNSADFSNEVGRLFWHDQALATAYIRKLCTVDVLYLDDLDKAKFTDRTEAEVYHVINSRTEQGLPILATVNVQGDKLAELMSDNRGWPIVRRLRDYCASVHFKK